MLRFTGHPIADVGVATILVFSGKTEPEDLTPRDLEAVGRYLLQHYTRPWLNPYLSCLFPNSGYFQAYIQQKTKGQISPKIADEIESVLFGFRRSPEPKAQGYRCVFSGQPADRIVYRQHVPMITGENVLNFFPAGLGGMPIASPYLLAIQAFPLGARRCEGRALAVHSDDPALTIAFASRALQDNRRFLGLEAVKGEGDKYPDVKAPRSLALDELVEIERRRQLPAEGTAAPSVTVYHLTNSGRGPDLDIHHLPGQVVRFVQRALRDPYRQAFTALVAVSWEKPEQRPKKGGRRKGASADKTGDTAWGPGKTRNRLYEDLFRLFSGLALLPDEARRFIGRHFLRRADVTALCFNGSSPDERQAIERQLRLVSWPLTELFIKEVMGMEKERIAAIRTVADRVADHIDRYNDTKFYKRLFYHARRYGEFRNLLLKASRERLRNREGPLVSFDEFLLAFEVPEGTSSAGWDLARDLMLIRIIDLLHERWGARISEVMADEAAEDAESEEDEEPALAGRRAGRY